MIKMFKSTAMGLILTVVLAAGIQAHPLESLTAEEYQTINGVLREAGIVNDDTLYPLIELKEPHKKEVLAWKSKGDAVDRKAIVQFTSDKGFSEALVNITKGKVESHEPIEGSGQPMVLFTEFLAALDSVLGEPAMVAGLKKRGLTPDDVFCLPLTAGNFFTDLYENSRLMKVPCYQNPTGSNFYAKPIEGLFALTDIGKRKVIEVIDTGVVPVPQDPWGYTEEEVAERLPLRPVTNPASLSQPGGPNYKLKGNEVEWDIWRFNYRIDKRPGLVISNLEANDQGTWRSVIYQMHLSEVFVPYMDPTAGWYWRTYMDSGEYGFGVFLSPLTPGIDCPEYATFLPVMIADDAGQPLEIPDAICIFERSLGDPAWRHFELFAQSDDTFVAAEGRPETELVIRTASEVGNYDYLIDYRLKQDGQIYIKIGATGLDAVKGVASESMDDWTARWDTKYGTLVAPNLVAVNHDHYFNFRIDFDIDQPNNMFSTMEIVPGRVWRDSPRKSLWTMKRSMPHSEMDARYTISAMKPKHFHISNPFRKGHLGHKPGWMLHHGSIAYGPFDFEKDAPFVRNPWIKYSVWNTVYDPEERYAGGKYAMQSDGSDTLLTYASDNERLIGKDVVTWFTAGFHHIPRMEDWPVMSTEWKTIHMKPYNFFANNPALTLRKGKE